MKNLINKTYVLFYSLIVVFLISGNSFSQVIVDIGTGTSSQGWPFGIYYGYYRSAAIYTSAEIGNFGSIQELAWYVSSAQSTNYPLKIYIKTISGSTLTSDTWANMTTGATEVYSGTRSFNTTGWNSINITDFTYSANNLLVLCEVNYGGAGTNINPSFYFSTASLKHQTWQQDNSAPTGNGIVADNRPNLRITMSTGPMTYSSSLVTQNTSFVAKGSTDQQIIGIQVVTSGSDSPISLTQLNLNTNGTTNTADISNAKIYYTGTSSTYSAINQFGSTTLSPSGTFNITGTQQLSTGTNYFWLTYDISPGATTDNYADAECIQITVSGINYTPSTTAPAGGRQIKGPMTGTYTIKNSGGDFSTTGEAVNLLNLLGVGEGGVIFTIEDGQTFVETPITITATGTSSRSITFKQSGIGTKPILNFTGTSSTNDACFTLNGSDYLVFNGLYIRDNGSASTNRADIGFYLFNSSNTDGSSNNVIKNCIVELYRLVNYSIGVLVKSTATNSAGASGNNKFYNNYITKCNNGYQFIGTTNAYGDGNEVGTVDGGTSTITKIGYELTVAGIYFDYQTNFKAFSNNISELTISSESSSSNLFAICVQTGNNTGDVYSNVVDSLIRSGTYSTQTIGININSATSINVYLNVISNVKNTNSSGGYEVTGVYFGYCVNAYIYNNAISSISTYFTGSYGIRINGTGNFYIYKNKIFKIEFLSNSYGSNAYGLSVINGTNVYVYNNQISDINAPGTTSDNNTPTAGILIGGSTSNAHIYYNTVYLKYTSTKATNKSAAIAITSGPSITMKNNIFINDVDVTTTAGQWATALYRLGFTAFTNISSLCDNNLFYAGTPGTKKLIHYDGTNSDQTLAAFKTRFYPREQNSVTELPPFTNISSTPYDLHIQTLIPTQVESGGNRITTPFAISNDFENTIRFGETGYSGTGIAPDLGAFEGNYTINDLVPPNIGYTVLGNKSGTATRSFIGIYITDKSGVNIDAGTKPRCYYKKTTNTNTYNDNTNATDGWKYVEANGTSSPFDFTIDYSKINGGVAIGEFIQYFVVAQDLFTTPNVGIYSGSFAIQPTSVSLTSAAFPIGGTINSFKVLSALSGTYTIGASSCNYSSITSAMSALKDAEVTSAVTYLLKDASYTTTTGETFPIRIFSPVGISLTNNVTIKPDAGVITSISTSGIGTDSAVFKLDGADYITIDGSNNGSTSTDLTLTNNYYNLSYGQYYNVLWLTSNGSSDGATNNIIKNCIVVGQSYNYFGYGILLGGTTLGSSAQKENSCNQILNNQIYKARRGIYLYGKSGAIPDSGNIIQQNIIGGTTGSIGTHGIYMTYQKYATINQNDIQRISYSGQDLFGIYLNDIRYSTVSRNTIHYIRNSTTSDKKVIGINIISTDNTSATPSENLIVNNSVYDLINSTTTTNNYFRISGINLNRGYGDKIYYNTVYLFGEIFGSGGTGTASAFSNNYTNSGGSNTYFELKNNIFVVIGKSSASGSNFVAHYSAINNYSTVDYNYNLLYSETSAGSNSYIGFNSTQYVSTLADWKTATGKEANSKSSTPNINTGTVPKPFPNSPAVDGGTPIPAVTVDYDGVSRDLTTPNIGAYETSEDISGPSFTYTSLSNDYASPRSVTNIVITDYTGVNVISGTKPRVYYKRFTDGNVFNGNTSSTDGWKYTEAANSSSPFTFSIDYSKLSGDSSVTYGTLIQYFFVAQDTKETPLVSISNGTFTTLPASVDLQSANFPITGTLPQYKNILAPMSGDYIIGSGNYFTTITSALAHIVDRGVSAAVRFLLNDATYASETFPITINSFSGQSNTKTLTIKPNTGISPTITSNNSSGVFKISSGYVIIDGSNAIDGTSKNLTLTSTAISSPNIIWIANPGTDLIRNIWVKNCNLINGNNTSGSYVVYFANTNDSYGVASNVTIQNNKFEYSSCGVYAYSDQDPLSGLYLDSLYILNNLMNTSGANCITKNGIFFQGVYNSKISGNTIANFDPTNKNEQDKGIDISTNCEKVIVEKNTIHSIGADYTPDLSTNCFAGIGIYLNTTNSTSLIYIRNNVIYNIYGMGKDWQNYGDQNPAAIYIEEDQNEIYIYNNSIYLYGNTLDNYNAVSSGIFLNSKFAYSNADIENNCIVNNLGVKTSTGKGSYAIIKFNNNGSIYTDNNNYYCNPTGTGSKALILDNGTELKTIAEVQGSLGDDYGSYTVDPAYTSQTNLIPDVTNSNCWVLNQTGYPYPEVPDDFNGTARNIAIEEGPIDIGAYEFTPTAAQPSPTQSGTLALNGTTSYEYFGRKLADIVWGNTGTVPTSITFKYFPGVNPPGASSGKFSKAYWEINAEGGAGYVYDLILYFDNSIFGTVGLAADIQLAQKSGSGNWFHYSNSVVNETFLTLTKTGLTTFSYFALSNKNNPLPVQLQSLSANVVGRNAMINWKTATELNVSGFEIEKRVSSNEYVISSKWDKIGFIQGAGNSNSVKNYSFTDKNLNSGIYIYRLKMIDNDESFKYSDELKIEIDKPSITDLKQNYPNSFNPTTKIEYQLANKSKIKLELFNITGQLVSTLVDEESDAGYYLYYLDMNRVNNGLATGIYIYRMTAIKNLTNEKFVITKKMLFMK